MKRIFAALLTLAILAFGNEALPANASAVTSSAVSSDTNAALRDRGFAAGCSAADNEAGAVLPTCCASSVCWPVAAPIAASWAWRTRSAVPPALLKGQPAAYAAGFSDGYLRRATERRRIETITGIVGAACFSRPLCSS